MIYSGVVKFLFYVVGPWGMNDILILTTLAKEFFVCMNRIQFDKNLVIEQQMQLAT